MQKKQVLIGNTRIILQGGKITGLSREGVSYTESDSNFEGSLMYVLVMAAANHKEKLLELIKELKPASDDITFRALSALSDCEIAEPIKEAVSTVLTA